MGMLLGCSVDLISPLSITLFSPLSPIADLLAKLVSPNPHEALSAPFPTYLPSPPELTSDFLGLKVSRELPRDLRLATPEEVLGATVKASHKRSYIGVTWAIVNIMDSRAILRMDVRFCTRIMLGPALKSLYGIHGTIDLGSYGILIQGLLGCI